MLRGPLPKDVELLLEYAGTPQRRTARIREQRGDQLLVELVPGLRSDPRSGPDDRRLPAEGAPVKVFLERQGAFFVIPARSLGESAVEPGLLELELRGEPERLERRFSVRVAAEGLGVRASLGGEGCPVVELCEISFAVRARADLEVGDVVEAVVFDAGEALPGRVRVESKQPLEPGWWRYGLMCLDGRLKFDLSAVALAVQRSRIGLARGD